MDLPMSQDTGAAAQVPTVHARKAKGLRVALLMNIPGNATRLGHHVPISLLYLGAQLTRQGHASSMLDRRTFANDQDYVRAVRSAEPQLVGVALGDGLLAAIPQRLECLAGVGDDLLDQVLACLGIAMLECGPSIRNDLGQEAKERLVPLGPGNATTHRAVSLKIDHPRRAVMVKHERPRTPRGTGMPGHSRQQKLHAERAASEGRKWPTEDAKPGLAR